MLLKMVQAGRLDPAKLISHRFKIPEILKAYDTFTNASREQALKVVIKNERS
jgi:alcohol dehydrogenase